MRTKILFQNGVLEFLITDMLKVSTAQEKKQWDPKGEGKREEGKKTRGCLFFAQHQNMPMQDHKNLDFTNKSMMLL